MTQRPEDTSGRSRQVRIEIDDSVADGTYANLAFVSSNNAEFILDFARFLPGNTRGKVVTRIVLNPVHAKGVLVSLSDAVDSYEKKFGQITVHKQDKNIGFQINQDSAQDKK